MKLPIILLTVIFTLTGAAQAGPGKLADSQRKAIREFAQRTWPGNPSMIRYEIKRQTAAALEIEDFGKEKGVPVSILTEIKDQAALDWPKDYVMQLWQIDNHLKRYLER